MPWNEPSGDDRDPWGKRKKNNTDQGPPNLDEALKQMMDFISGIMGKKKSGKNGSPPFKNTSSFGMKSILFLLLLVCVGGYLYKSIYTVDQKKRAVILRFGKYVETVGPGLHMYFPPIEKRLQTLVTGYRVYKLGQEMLTKDENIVQVTLSVQYNISDLESYQLKVANPVLSLEEATQSALRHVVGSSTMHEVLTEGREVLADEVLSRLQRYLDSYTTGLHVSRVNVESAQPPSQVQASFDDVIRAREDEERAKNNAYAYSNQIVPEARGQAQKIIQKANAYAKEVVALAEGQASRFNSLLAVYELSPEVTRERIYLDSMEKILSSSSKILVDQNGSNNLFYLPLDQMINKNAKGLNDTNKQFSSLQQSMMANKLKNKSGHKQNDFEGVNQ